MLQRILQIFLLFASIQQETYFLLAPLPLGQNESEFTRMYENMFHQNDCSFAYESNSFLYKMFCMLLVIKTGKRVIGRYGLLVIQCQLS